MKISNNDGSSPFGSRSSTSTSTITSTDPELRAKPALWYNAAVVSETRTGNVERPERKVKSPQHGPLAQLASALP